MSVIADLRKAVAAAKDECEGHLHWLLGELERQLDLHKPNDGENITPAPEPDPEEEATTEEATTEDESDVKDEPVAAKPRRTPRKRD